MELREEALRGKDMLQEQQHVQQNQLVPAAAPIAPIEEEEEAAANLVPKQGAGRPRKHDGKFDIHRYIRRHREGIYELTDASYSPKCTYFCVPCQKQVSFWSQTCLAKMSGKNGHERSDKHVRGLAAQQRRAPQPPLQDQASEVAVVQVANERCNGCSVEDEPLMDISESIRKFVFHGQPRTAYKPAESDPLAGVNIIMTSEAIRLQSHKCTGTPACAASFCKECRRCCLRVELKKHICRKAYFIDLVILAWKLLHVPDAEALRHSASMQQADYVLAGHAGQDLKELLRDGMSKLDIVRSICHRAECIPVHRQSPALKAFLKGFLVQAHLFHSTDDEARAHAALATTLANSVAQGKAHQLDLALAAKVASGQLRQDSLIQALTATFLMQYQAGLQNTRRRNSSQFVELESIEVALTSLGRRAEVDAMLARFHVNARSIPSSPLTNPWLPAAFLSLKNEADVSDAVKKSLSILKLSGQRAHVLLDETVWAPSFEQVAGLKVTAEGIRESGDIGTHRMTGPTYPLPITRPATYRRPWGAMWFVSLSGTLDDVSYL